MKNILFPAAVAALCFSACSTDEPTANLTARIKTDTTEIKHVTITFNCRGFDITTASFSDADQTTPRSALPLCLQRTLTPGARVKCI